MGQSGSAENSGERINSQSDPSVNLTSIIGIGTGERNVTKTHRLGSHPAPLKHNPDQNVRVMDTATVIVGNNSHHNHPSNEDNVSQYSVDELSPNKDDGTAPMLFPFRFEDPANRKKRRCDCLVCSKCCKRRRKKGDQSADSEPILLQELSHPAPAVRGKRFSKDGADVFVDTTATTTATPAATEAHHKDDPHHDEEHVKPPRSASIGKIKGKVRRQKIPPRPDVNMSLWSIVKNAIGKDLTKLPLPVNFNEPISMLQRLTEDFEYSHLIDKGALAADALRQMSYVVAFTISSYATSAVRTGKPFNPILGETYECDRSMDLGWKCINEQVSHHPPLVAQYCRGRKWECWQQFSMSSKFRGNSIEIIPLGISHLSYVDSGNHYTWRKVPSIVHNIMLGKLWIDQEGEMDVFNHMTGDSCHITYTATSFFRSDAKKVEGTIYNYKKEPKLFLTGFWDQKMEVCDIVKVDSKGNFSLGARTLLWTRNMPPSDSEKYYNFTLLACQLNEMEEGIAPTDSRRRPDQRLMENGYFDQANAEKLRLEEKQRQARKTRLTQLSHRTTTTSVAVKTEDDLVREKNEPGWLPAWFALEKDIVTGKMTYVYQGKYWECKDKQEWSRCPEIF